MAKRQERLRGSAWRTLSGLSHLWTPLSVVRPDVKGKRDVLKSWPSILHSGRRAKPMFPDYRAETSCRVGPSPCCQ